MTPIEKLVDEVALDQDLTLPPDEKSNHYWKVGFIYCRSLFKTAFEQNKIVAV